MGISKTFSKAKNLKNKIKKLRVSSTDGYEFEIDGWRVGFKRRQDLGHKYIEEAPCI